MSNAFILWAIMVLSWLSLFFMKNEEIRHYFPVGLFAALSSIVIVDIGSTLHLWVQRDNIFPLSKIFPYHLGAVPVVTMWLFKFTYGNPLKYVIVDVFYNVLFAFLLLPWFAIRGIRENINVTNLELFFIVTLHGILLYVYQILQEGQPLRLNIFSLQGAAAKPHLGDKDKQ